MANRKNFKFKNREIRSEENPIDIIIPAGINMVDSGRKTMPKAAVVNNGNSVVETVKRAIEEDRIEINIPSSSFNKMSRVVTGSDSYIASDSNSTVFYNKPGGGAESYILPANPVNHTTITLVSYDVGGGVWSINGNGKTINSQGIITMAVDKQSMTIEFNTTLDEWVILSVA